MHNAIAGLDVCFDNFRAFCVGVRLSLLVDGTVLTNSSCEFPVQHCDLFGAYQILGIYVALRDVSLQDLFHIDTSREWRGDFEGVVRGGKYSVWSVVQCVYEIIIIQESTKDGEVFATACKFGF